MRINIHDRSHLGPGGGGGGSVRVSVRPSVCHTGFDAQLIKSGRAFTSNRNPQKQYVRMRVLARVHV